MTTEWQVWNDTPIWLKPRRTVYFIARNDADGNREDYRDKAGRLRTWRTREAAMVKCIKLGGVDPFAAKETP